ncbi:MAG: site-2 protease family protein [Anaerolineae bacterium]
MLFGLSSNIAFLIALIIGVTVHECAHAWMANQLGDPTARLMGRLSLNPVVHFDPLGALMMVIMAFQRVGIAWGKPTPVNPYHLRHGPRVGMGMVSLAGPLSNLLLAAVVAVPLRLGLPLPGLLGLLVWTVVIANIGLAVFNLLPIPPLDGFSVLMGILSTIRARWAHEWSSTLARLESQGMMVLFFVLMFDVVVGRLLGFSLLGAILRPPSTLLIQLIVG